MRSKHSVRSKCARNCLWPDVARRKWPLIRPKSDHCPDNCATKAQIIPRPSSRRLWAWDDLWSDYRQTKNATDQIIFLTSSRPTPGHCTNVCALKLTSHQTIPRANMFYVSDILRNFKLQMYLIFREKEFFWAVFMGYFEIKFEIKFPMLQLFISAR